MTRILSILALALLFGVFLVSTVQAAPPIGTPLTHGRQAKSVTATTKSVTTPANQLTLMWVATTNGGNGQPKIQDSMRSWGTVQTGSPGLRRLTLFYTLSVAPEPVTGPVTMVNPQGQITGWAWTMITFPANTVLQSQYQDYKMLGVKNPKQVTLPNAGNRGFVVAGFAMNRGDSPIKPGDGYFLIGGQPCQNICVQAIGRKDFAQSAKASWDRYPNHWMGIAAELRVCPCTMD